MNKTSIVVKIILIIVVMTFFREPITDILTPLLDDFHGISSILLLFELSNLKSNLPIIGILLGIFFMIGYKFRMIFTKIHKNFIANENTFKENLEKIFKENKILIIIIIILLPLRFIVFNYVL